jgi:hypothetical protein
MVRLLNLFDTRLHHHRHRAMEETLVEKTVLACVHASNVNGRNTIPRFTSLCEGPVMIELTSPIIEFSLKHSSFRQ